MYRKCPTNEHGFDPGCISPVFESHGWRFGVNICYDANFPDAAAELRQQGARLIFNNMLAPATAAKWRPRSLENLQRRSVETGCWIISSDVVGQYQNQLSYGCTCIVRPDGVIVQQAPEGAEQAILYDLV
jgi:predicted amidohydrolase